MERVWGSLGTEDRVRAHGTGIFNVSFAPKLWENRLTIQPFRQSQGTGSECRHQLLKSS